MKVCYVTQVLKQSICSPQNDVSLLHTLIGYTTLLYCNLDAMGPRYKLSLKTESVKL